MENRFFYCYSPPLYRFLKQAGIKYVCTGLNESSMRQFWQFERNDKLNELLTEYAGNKPG
ncbi:MAG: hypothetical protein AB2401_12480 [Bacillus sp. (in: firmicutes)]